MDNPIDKDTDKMIIEINRASLKLTDGVVFRFDDLPLDDFLKDLRKLREFPIHRDVEPLFMPRGDTR